DGRNLGLHQQPTGRRSLRPAADVSQPGFGWNYFFLDRHRTKSADLARSITKRSAQRSLAKRRGKSRPRPVAACRHDVATTSEPCGQAHPEWASSGVGRTRANDEGTRRRPVINFLQIVLKI